MLDETFATPVSDFERQQALDKALSSFGNNQPITGVVAKSISGIPGAGYTNNPEIVDEELLQTEEQTEIEPADEDFQEEPEVDEAEEGLSEGFVGEFKKAFGIEPTEAVETFNTLLNFKNEILLMQEWDVTPGEYRNRMSTIKEFYQGLPEDGRDQFNSPEGAMAIWNHLHPEGQKAAKTTSVKPSRKTNKQPSKPAFVFTKDQILRMSADEFKANASRIQQAYLNGQVKE